MFVFYFMRRDSGNSA